MLRGQQYFGSEFDLRFLEDLTRPLGVKAVTLSLLMACFGLVGCDSTTEVVDAATVDAADAVASDVATEPGAPWVPPQSTLPEAKVCYGVEGAGSPVPPPAADASDVGSASDAISDVLVPDSGPDIASDIASETTEDVGPDTCANCAGAAMPAYTLADFQPQSCSFERAYGIDSFKGRPTVAVLLAAW